MRGMRSTLSGFFVRPSPWEEHLETFNPFWEPVTSNTPCVNGSFLCNLFFFGARGGSRLAPLAKDSVAISVPLEFFPLIRRKANQHPPFLLSVPCSSSPTMTVRTFFLILPRARLASLPSGPVCRVMQSFVDYSSFILSRFSLVCKV